MAIDRWILALALAVALPLSGCAATRSGPATDAGQAYERFDARDEIARERREAAKRWEGWHPWWWR